MTRTDSATRDVQPWQLIIQRILAALMVASLVFLAEKLLVQLISISYHRKQFDVKIKESKHNVYLLSLLYDASRAIFPAYCPEFAEEDYAINASIEIAAITKGSGQARSGSVTPMRLIQNVGRVGDKITAAFGNVAHEITGMQVFNPTAAHSVVVEALEKIKSSEALAKRLWMSFVIEGQDALYPEDIIEVLGSERTAEAEECFAALDMDGNGDISLDEMILTVCEFGRQRHSIANSMHDVDQAINVLDKLLCTVVAIISIFVFVAFLNSSFTTTLATAGTALLSMSFVFATTAQEVLGSCIFLFVKHPFDVGDRVDIGDEQLTVEHISLLFTVFKRLKTHKTTQVPNVVLNANWIDNISRSKAMREQILLYINFDTSLEDIQLLRNEMQVFLLDKDNCRDFQSDIDVEVTGIAEMNKMELRVEIRHKSNWANETVRAARRSRFMCALVLALRKIPIYGPSSGDAALGDMSKPTYSVAVTDAEAAANREAFTAKKEAKRLVSSKKPEVPQTEEYSSKSTGVDPSGTNSSNRSGTLRGRTDTRPTAATAGMSTTENTVVETLNARQPGLDPARDPDDNDWVGGHYRDDSDSGNSTLDQLEPERTSSDEARRSKDIEEVRGLLHREPTKGRRKRAPTAGAVPDMAPIAGMEGNGDGMAEGPLRSHAAPPRGAEAQHGGTYSRSVQQQAWAQYPAQVPTGGLPRQGQYMGPVQQQRQ
jgi:small-conductance mechanosensitive channel